MCNCAALCHRWHFCLRVYACGVHSVTFDGISFTPLLLQFLFTRSQWMDRVHLSCHLTALCFVCPFSCLEFLPPVTLTHPPKEETCLRFFGTPWKFLTVFFCGNFRLSGPRRWNLVQWKIIHVELYKIYWDFYKLTHKQGSPVNVAGYLSIFLRK